MDIAKDVHGYWQLNYNLYLLLNSCTYRDSCRYELDHVIVTDHKMATTNGKQLVEVNCKHRSEPGLYYLAPQGFLLPNENAIYPDYKSLLDICQKEVFSTSEDLWRASGAILGTLTNIGVFVDVRPLMKILDLLIKLEAYDTKVYSEDKDKAFMLTARTCVGTVRYMMIPAMSSKE